MTALRLQGIALLGVVERNTYLIKRYGWWELAFFIWTIANTLSIVFISKAANLSRGTQQKVALARALLTSPVLLLLDEPTTGLDPRSKLEVQDFIREVRLIHDTTILLCTHDLAEAEILAERIGILDDGRLLCLLPADEIKLLYGAETLEEAFFAATGRAFDHEVEAA